MKSISTNISKVVAVLASVLLLSACGAVKDLEPEVVLGDDTAFVMSFDHSDLGQIESLKSLLENFPDSGLSEMLIQQYDAGVMSSSLRYENALKPIVEGKWRILLGISFDERVKSFEDISALTANFYLVVKLEKADELEVLLDKLIEEGEQGVDKTVDGDFTSWHGTNGGLYITRYGDLFFTAMDEEKMLAAVDRVKDGKGFEIGGKLGQSDLVDEPKLGYIYVSSEEFFGLVREFYNEMGVSFISEYIDAIGDVYVAGMVDKEGLSLVSMAEVKDDDSELIEIYEDYELQLINKVPAQGMILYVEDPDLSVALKSMSLGASMELGEESPDFYSELVKEIAAMGEASVDEVRDVFASPYAVAVSDVGALYPAVAIYLQLDEDKVQSAKALDKGVDAFVDEVLVELDKRLDEVGAAKGMLKKELVLVRGQALNKLYFDLNLLPEQSMKELEDLLGEKLDDVKVELYYGITGDNVYTIALYPDFADAYGKEVLAQDALYLTATEKVKDYFGSSLEYINLAPLFDIADMYMEIVNNAGEVSDEDYATYAIVKTVAKEFKYLIGSSILDGDFLKSVLYLRIGK